MKRASLSIAIAAVLTANFASASDFGSSNVQGLLYFKQPFGGNSHQYSPRLGFAFDYRGTSQGPFDTQSADIALLSRDRLPPLFNFEFGEEGMESFRVNGLEAKQMILQSNAAGGEEATTINWWVVGGIIAAGAAVVAITDDADEQNTPPFVPASGGGPG